MIDRKAFRLQHGILEQALARRHVDLIAEGSSWQQAWELDQQQRQYKTEAETLQAKRNAVSKSIGLKKRQGEDASEELAAMAYVSKHLKSLESKARDAEEAFAQVLLDIPNPPASITPDGESEDDNIELRRWGQPRCDSVPAHWDIGTDLGLLDFDAGVKLSGSRFTVLRKDAARLERALMQLMLDTHVDEHGYEEVWTPVLVNRQSMQGTGQLPKFADDLYKIEGEELFLIPTAEVSITNLYQGDVLDGQQLPIQHCAYTPCFRKEAGSAGRDVRGMIRQHQFDKVELVHLCAVDQAESQLQKLLSHAERILQKLELPYRVMQLCTADLGFSAEQTIDLEVWLPSQQCYREISSCSSFGQFQGRRAAIRYRDEQKKVQPVATVNGSGLAIGRCLIAVLENGWQEDGRIQLPEALRAYMGGKKFIA